MAFWLVGYSGLSDCRWGIPSRHGFSFRLCCTELCLSRPISAVGVGLHLFWLDRYVWQLSLPGGGHPGPPPSGYAHPARAVVARPTARRRHCRGAGSLHRPRGRCGRLLGMVRPRHGLLWHSAAQLRGLVCAHGACAIGLDRDCPTASLESLAQGRYGSRRLGSPGHSGRGSLGAAESGAGGLRGVVRWLSSYRSVRLMLRALCTSSGQPMGTHTVTSGTLRSDPRLSSGAVVHRMIPTPRHPHTVFWFLHALSLLAAKAWMYGSVP